MLFPPPFLLNQYHSQFIKMFLILAVLSSVSSEVIDYPLWPDLFKQTFNETFKYPGGKDKYTTGTFYYNWVNKTYRVDRENGRHDRYCGFNGDKMWKDTPCSHYVSNGDRYLYYPKLKECCYCCSNIHGCGILRPDWMNGGEFINTTEQQGQQSYLWDKKGLQHNYYFETISEKSLDRVLLGIYQEPNDLQDFHLPRTIPTHEDFVLPSICVKKRECSLLSTCTAVRHAAN